MAAPGRLMLPEQIAAVPEFVEVKYLDLLNSRLSLVIPALIQVIAHFPSSRALQDDPARTGRRCSHRRGRANYRSSRLVMSALVLACHKCRDDHHRASTSGTTSSGPTSTSRARPGWSRALGLVTLQNAYLSGPVGAIFAGLSILVIPVVVFFAFVQRQLMEGLGFAGVAR